jgi:hypothetical protein
MSLPAKNRAKSLGTLFASKKTEEKSSDMTGKMKILKETLREILRTHQEEDGDVFEVNLAGWFNNSGEKMYMTLELSPLYRPAVQRSKRDITFEEFFNEIIEEQE